jgi:hypothetical protein
MIPLLARIKASSDPACGESALRGTMSIGFSVARSIVYAKSICRAGVEKQYRSTTTPCAQEREKQ